MIDKIKKIPEKLNLIKALIFVICITVYCVLTVVSSALTGSLPSQTAAKRFAPDDDYAQATAFIEQTHALPADMMAVFRYQLGTELENRAFEDDEVKGRPYVYAYSAPAGSMKVASSRGSSVTASVTAVGGDFFIFHPYRLLDGAYFNDEDENGDGVMLDADTAWALFGSSNIAGMEVEINDRAYPVRGVIQRESGPFTKASGDAASMIFVTFGVANSMSADAVEGSFTDNAFTGATCFEMLMKNPVKGFTRDVLSKVLKDSFGLTDDDLEVIENSSRYSLLSELNVIRNFGKRSMKTEDIIYPGWENRARAYEDVVAVMLLFRIMLLVYPVFIMVKYGIIFIKFLHTKLKSGINKIKNRLEKRYEKKWLEKQEANE